MSGESRSSNDKSEVGGPTADEGGERKTGDRRTRKIVAGTAIGIGSAAIVAALLYANRSRKGAGKTERKPDKD
jgi:hypothetical protein